MRRTSISLLWSSKIQEVMFYTQKFIFNLIFTLKHFIKIFKTLTKRNMAYNSKINQKNPKSIPNYKTFQPYIYPFK
jgi:hypothetical protein